MRSRCAPLLPGLIVCGACVPPVRTGAVPPAIPTRPLRRVKVIVCPTGAPVDLDSLVQDSDLIAVGHVEGEPIVRGDSPNVVDVRSITTVRIETTLKGESGATVAVRTPGGRTSGVAVVPSLGANLTANTRYLLFLRKPRRPLPDSAPLSLSDSDRGQIRLVAGKTYPGRDRDRTIRPWRFLSPHSQQLIGVRETEALAAVRSAVARNRYRGVQLAPDTPGPDRLYRRR